MAPWQRITVYRYTLPPPYELATEHLFQELPLSTYPAGTTVEPLAYEMEPGASLGRAATWTTMLWSCFPDASPHEVRDQATSGCPFARRATVGLCVRMPPNGCPTHAKLPRGVPAPVGYSLSCLCSKTPHEPCVEATDAEATIAGQHALVRRYPGCCPARLRARTAHRLARADAPGDKTVVSAASAQRTLDTRLRHSAGRPLRGEWRRCQ